MLYAVTATSAIALAGLILWWLLGNRWANRIRISDLRGQIDEFLAIGEVGSGVSFSGKWNVWPVRLSIDGLTAGEGELTLTVYAADLGTEISPAVRARAEVSTDVLNQMRRPAVDDIACLVLGSLNLIDDGAADRMFVRYNPLVCGLRHEARIRDMYQPWTGDPHPRLFHKVHSVYERRTSGRRYEDMVSFRVWVKIENTHAPRYSEITRATSTAA